METPPDPPTLQYATPQEKPVVPTHPVVGILGFLVYGVLFLMFSAAGVSLAREFSLRPRMLDRYLAPASIIFLVWCFTLWRAFAALHGALRPRRKV